MLFARIDMQRLRRDIASVSAEIRTLKHVLRQTWTRPMADEQRRVVRLARRATELCILLARTRGRWHITTPPRDVRAAGDTWDRDAYHARIVERVGLDYTEDDGAAVEAAS